MSDELCSLFSRFLKGCRLGGAVSQGGCVCLAQWLNQSLACAGANSHSEISGCLGRRAPRPCQNLGPRQFTFSSALVSGVLQSKRVQWLSSKAQRGLCPCRNRPSCRACNRNACNSRLALAAEKHYKTKHCNRGFAMAPRRPTGRRHTPNQPMERTPPCCALRRRSSAR